VRAIGDRLGLCYLDSLRRTAGFTRHAEYAVLLSYRLRLVAAVLLVFRARGVQDLVLSCSCLSRIQEPFEDEDRADIHADTVCGAILPVHGYARPVDSVRVRVRIPIGVHPLYACGSNLVAVVLASDRILIWLLKEVRIDRTSLVTYVSGHLVCQEARPRPII
jgi:hypothetical protein